MRYGLPYKGSKNAIAALQDKDATQDALIESLKVRISEVKAKYGKERPK